MHKRIFSIALFLMITLPVNIYASVIPGGTTDSKEMKYRDGYLTYAINAPRGNKVVYSTIGHKFYFYSSTIKENGSPKKYETIVALDPSWQIEVIENPDGTNTATWAIPFKNFSNPTDVNANTIISRILKTYGGNTSYYNDIISFFNKGGTIYLDQIFTVKENGVPQGTLYANGTYTGEIYFTESQIKSARSWSRATMLAFSQYYGRYCIFLAQSIPVVLNPPSPVISRNSPGNGSIISSSTNFNINDEITLYADRSVWPDNAAEKYYKWEYKPTGTANFPATPFLSGINKVSVTYPNLAAGSYNVRLTEWYSTSDGVQHTEKSATKSIVMYIDDAGVAITPTIDADKIITQAQIDSGAMVNVNVSGLAQLVKFNDPSKVTKWIIHMRKDPAGTDSQYEQFTFTSNLGLTQSASKVFTIPANVLKYANSYTQYFALRAVATVNGSDITSSLVNCSITIKKETNNPVAVLTAPPSVQAGEIITLSGEKSYSKNGSIVSYSMSIPDIGWSSDKVTDLVSLPYDSTTSCEVFLTVTDNLGLTDTVSKTISVSAPTPVPVITASGKLKKNRIAYFNLDSSFSTPGYPIDHTKTIWSIQAVSGTGALNSSIYTVSNISTNPALVTGDPISSSFTNGKSKLPIMFKSRGTYQITATVTNTAGISGTTTKQFIIADDAAPVISFKQLASIYRDTPVDGTFYANLTVTDESYSPDGDYIAYRKIYAIYDVNNNGVFGDTGDTTILINESYDSNYIESNKKFTIQVKDVGRYQVNICAKEGFVP